MAGRIPQAFLDDLLDRADIVELIDRRVKLRKTGRNYSALCPFHDEKSPSFTVSPDKQFYYCFGCGASGNALGFIMEYENLDFPEAVENLAGSLGLEVPRERTSPAQAQREDGQRALLDTLEAAAEFYRQQLRRHARSDRAIAYLKQRGLTGQVAARFDLGFAPPGWDNLLQALGGDEQARTLLEQAGLLVRNDAGRVYDRFRDRVIFPIRDGRGRIIAFGGRVLGDDKPKYLNSPETPVFHKGRELYGLYQAREAKRKLERIVVVEGYMDVIALAQHGIDYAVATLGTSTSETHLERIFRLSPEVVFCFDGDEAGRKAAGRALETALPCLEDGRQARFLFLPEGEDPDTMVRSGGAARFEMLLQCAEPLESFLFESAGAGLDLESLDGRARMSKLALPLIARLPGGVYRELVLQALASRTGVALASLQQLLAEVPKPRPSVSAADGAPFSRSERTSAPRDPGQAGAGLEPGARPRRREPLATAPPRHCSLAQSAIALLLHKPEMARNVNPAELEELEGQDMDLLRELLDLLRRRPDSTTAMLLGHWYGSSEGELLGRLAGQERLIPREGIEHQFRDTVAELSRLPHRSRLEREVDKLKATNYADLSDQEKQRLRELVHAKHRMDIERSGRK
jgi:DNA primase